MNGDSVCRRQAIWQLKGNYKIFLQLYFVTVGLLILCVYEWTFETKSVIICYRLQTQNICQNPTPEDLYDFGLFLIEEILQWSNTSAKLGNRLIAE